MNVHIQHFSKCIFDAPEYATFTNFAKIRFFFRSHRVAKVEVKEKKTPNVINGIKRRVALVKCMAREEP